MVSMSIEWIVYIYVRSNFLEVLLEVPRNIKLGLFDNSYGFENPYLHGKSSHYPVKMG